MGKGLLYEVLHPFLSREPKPGEYAEVGPLLGIESRAVAVAVFRLRKQFQAMVREEVVQGVKDPALVEEELRFLAQAL
jgi:hypothetical protein